MDNHVCGELILGRGKHRKSKQYSHNKNQELVLFTCGDCHTKFRTICVLHNHLFSHKEGGSYSYDHITKTAFPKYDSTCAYAQVDDDLLSLIEHRNESNMIGNENTNKASQTSVKQNNSVGYLRQSRRIADKNIKYATAEQSTRIADQKSNKNFSIVVEHDDVTTKENKSADRGSIKECNQFNCSSSVSEINIKDSELVQTRTIGNKRKKISLMKSNKKGKLILESASTCNIDVDKGQTYCNVDIVIKDSEADMPMKNDSEISNQQPDVITASEALIAIGKTTDNGRNSATKNKKKKTCTSEIDSIENVTKNAPFNHSAGTDFKNDVSGRIKDGHSSDNNENTDKRECFDLNSDTQSQSQTKAKCPTCGKIGSRAMVSYHRYLHKESKELSCDKCGKTFQHPSGLKLHMKNHEEKKFNCTLCPRQFHRKKYLETHMCIHTGEKPYMCESCGMAYRDAMHLKRHIRHVHENVRKFECDICKEKFFRSDHLKCHRQRHFEPGWKCKYCPRKFKLPMDLERHSFRHSGESRWFCHLCNHGFRYPLPYYNHMLKNHGIKREEASMFRKLLIEKEKQKKEKLSSTVATSIQSGDKKEQEQFISENERQFVSSTLDGNKSTGLRTSTPSIDVGKILEVKRNTSTIGKNYRRDKSKKQRHSNQNDTCKEDILNDADETEHSANREQPSTDTQSLEIFYAQNSISNTEQILKLIDRQAFATSIGNTAGTRVLANTELDGDTHFQGLHIVTMEETVTADLGMMAELDGEDMQAVMFIDDNDCATEVVIDQVSTL